MTPQDKYQKIMEVIGQVQKWEWTGHNDCLVCWEQAIFTTHTCRVILPIHIWDVLSYIESLPWSYWIGKWCHTYKTDKIIKLSEELLSIWEDKRNELAPTNEELVDYIYSLIA